MVVYVLLNHFLPDHGGRGSTSWLCLRSCCAVVLINPVTQAPLLFRIEMCEFRLCAGIRAVQATGPVGGDGPSGVVFQDICEGRPEGAFCSHGR